MNDYKYFIWFIVLFVVLTPIAFWVSFPVAVIILIIGAGIICYKINKEV